MQPASRYSQGAMAGSAAHTPASYASAPSAGIGGDIYERPPREMFDAVCADCGRTASVPFRPSGIKPVYCSDCFHNRR